VTIATQTIIAQTNYRIHIFECQRRSQCSNAQHINLYNENFILQH